MSSPVLRQRVRPLPGAIPEARAVRDRTWWDALHGWPAELPMDRRLAQRARFEASRTSVRQDMHRRFAGRMTAIRRVSVGTVVVVVIVLSSQEWSRLLFGETLLGMLSHVGSIVGGAVWFWYRSLRQFHVPMRRAALRREGVDCCIDCGQLMGRGRIDDTCTECERTHTDFPLGWGPGRFGHDPLAGDADEDSSGPDPGASADVGASSDHDHDHGRDASPDAGPGADADRDAAPSSDLDPAAHPTATSLRHPTRRGGR